jgi:hypothetical protein
MNSVGPEAHFVLPDPLLGPKADYMLLDPIPPPELIEIGPEGGGGRITGDCVLPLLTWFG